MLYQQMVVNRIKARVINRTPSEEVIISTSVNIELKRFVAEDGFVEYAFQIEISSQFGEIVVNGSLVLVASTEEEAKELAKVIEESENGVPRFVYEYIVSNMNPLITLIEKEMGLPIEPVQVDEDDGNNKNLLYYQ